ncbi:MAG TPA: hypothetical protein VEO54_30985 [Thermoanaerobaculia bacterium]|nr:hypothetical protein [Thermoanaerobaculia bacterium]
MRIARNALDAGRASARPARPRGSNRSNPEGRETNLFIATRAPGRAEARPTLSMRIARNALDVGRASARPALAGDEIVRCVLSRLTLAFAAS